MRDAAARNFHAPQGRAAACEPSIDVCRPRIRRPLLVVDGGRAPAAGAAAVLDETARRLGTRVTRLPDAGAVAGHLDGGTAACVLFVAPEDGGALAKLGELCDVCGEIPIVALGLDAESALAVAAVDAGAQDFVVESEVDAPTLERAIRYAIDRKRTEVQLAHLAHHDQLTGLPNRVLFSELLDRALLRRAEGSTVVLFIDVDGFKRVNDNLGHTAGDRALREAARRITAAVRPGDTVARLGGDEFTVLCDDVPDEAQALAIGERVARSLRRPLAIDGDEVVLRASVGVAAATEAVHDGEALLRAADAAMYEAKRRGGARAHVVSPAGPKEHNELALESALRRAIPSELRVRYQPRVRLTDGTPVSVEALMRWERPGEGLVAPGEFIPLAEQSGLIVPMGRWILHEACAEAAGWATPLPVSVNVSARQVSGLTIVDDVRDALESSGLPPERLELELTESILMDDVEDCADVIAALKALGVSLVLDDFGKGWSSLSYLKRFPVDAIKIDRAFVCELPGSREDLAIVAAVISFARALGLQAVAEGVETQEHVDALLELGCEYAQGFHFHRPIAPEAMRVLAGGQAASTPDAA